MRRTLRTVCCLLVISSCGGPRAKQTEPSAACPGPPPVRSTEAAAQQLLQSNHQKPVRHLAFSSKPYLATGSEDGEVRIWDTRTMLQLAVIQTDRIHDLGWSSDGDRIVILGDHAGRGFGKSQLAGRARVFDVGGAHVGTWPIAVDSLRALPGAGDRWIARAGGDGVLLDLSACTTEAYDFDCYGSACNSETSVAGDGSLFASVAVPERRYVIHRPGDSTPVAEVVADALALLPGNRFVMRDDRALSIRRLPGQQIVRALSTSSPGAALVVDGTSLVAWSAHRVEIFELTAGARAWKREIDDVEVTAVAARSGSLAIATADRRVVLHDLRTGRLRAELGPGAARVPVAAPLVVGSQLFLRSSDSVSVWSLESGRRTFSMPAPRSLDLVIRSTDRVDVALRAEADTGRDVRSVVLREIAMPPTSDAGEVRAVADEVLPVQRDVEKIGDLHPTSPRALVRIGAMTVATAVGGKSGMLVDEGWRDTKFSPTGRLVVVKRSDGLEIVESDTAEVVLEVPRVDARLEVPTASVPEPVVCAGIRDHSGGTIMRIIAGIRHHAFSADERWFAVEYDGHFRIHDMTSKQVITGAIPERITAIALAHDGTLLLGTADGELLAWSEGAVRRRGSAGGGRIEHVSLDASSRAVTVSVDGAARVWDLASMQVLVALADFEDDEWVSFTPNGAYTGSAEVAERVTWRFAAPFEAFRFEQFEREFRLAELIARRMSSRGPDVAVRPVRPPRVEILGHAVDAHRGIAQVRARVTSGGRVDSISGFREGRAVAQEQVCRGEGEVVLDVPLLAGSNRLQLTAFDERGASSNPLALDVAAPASRPRPELWIVAVGVSTRCSRSVSSSGTPTTMHVGSPRHSSGMRGPGRRSPVPTRRSCSTAR